MSGRYPQISNVVVNSKRDTISSMKKKPNNVQARLTVYGMADMNKEKLAFFKKWLMAVALEIKRARAADYSKVFRSTLFK